MTGAIKPTLQDNNTYLYREFKEEGDHATLTRRLQVLENRKELGIETMFSKNADLSGIFGNSLANMTEVTDVFHKAKIEVNEEGTVAAASTAVYAEALSSSSAVPLKIDHPFLFFIMDAKTGFLFEGKYSSPDNISQQVEHVCVKFK